MAVSTSFDFTLTANEIIAKAFGILGKASEGKAISARMYEDGRSSLNLLVKTWGAQEHLWTMTEGSITLVASQAEYALATLFSVKPMRVLSVRRRVTSGSIDTPMMEWSRQEYYDQSNKTVASVPTAWYYDPQRALGTLSIWPTASTSTATDMTLKVTYLRSMADFDTSSDNPDLPQEWLQALIWNLAVDLMPQYPVNDSNLSQLVLARAAGLYKDMKGWDNEPASIFLQPDFC
jgi:hypothetical protein